MDNEYVWSETRSDARDLYGSLPRPEDETALMSAFAEDPARVIAEIKAVGDSYDRGEVRYPWGLLRSRIEKRAAAEVKVPAAKVRTAKVIAAEQWIRTAGFHFDRASEIETELFDRGGKLDAYADDDALRDRMLDLWREVRPKGEAVEAEARARAERWKASRVPLRGEPSR